MEIKKRPELVSLPETPTILKVSEIPSGTYVMKRNIPFTITHLAKSGVEKAFILARTGKSVATILGKESYKLKEEKKELEMEIIKKYPDLAKHIVISLTAKVHFGYGRKGREVYYFCKNIPNLVETFNKCGFSDIPLRAFMIHIDNPSMWLHFVRRKDIGFIVSQFGNRLYSDMKLNQLEELISKNKILQDLQVYICETATATGKWTTCRVTPK
jgi:hypothetical protein